MKNIVDKMWEKTCYCAVCTLSQTHPRCALQYFKFWFQQPTLTGAHTHYTV